ncbi:MAG: nickel-dependent lactate racemase [Candidatus Freyarchaeota archaeon]|nr:nickel-dependent lactate racemase [Candidatus Jordarchaeia archaeon]MBS7280219.1 nickel-dependent lactate racemase [Candidatus Jordarchaeia archaeon]
MRDIQIPYGEKQIKFRIPSNWNLLGVLSPKVTNKRLDSYEAVLGAVRNPVDAEKLYSIAQRKGDAVILSDDNARPTPSNLIIPPLLDELNRAGIPDRKITVIIGVGLHEHLNERDLEKKLGKAVLERVNVLNHDPDNNLTHIGKTPQGVEILINKKVVEAELKIGIGSVTPHELMGFTGGAGIIIPGVAGRQTINQNHSLVKLFKAEFGKIEGNLIRKDSEDAARLLGLDMIVNVTMDVNENIYDVFAGNVVIAHQKAVEQAKKIYGVHLEKKVDVVIASSHPKDATFGKSMKAIFAASLAVKPDGAIIHVAPCWDGLSHSEVFEKMLLDNPKPKALFKMLDQGKLPGESCVLYLYSLVKSKHRIIVVTDGIEKETIEKIGLEHAEDLEAAIEKTGKQNADCVILPWGAVTLPLLKTS